MTKGDSAAVLGRAKLTSWERDGETHFGMSVIAEQVLSLYTLEKRRTRATKSEESADETPAPRLAKASAAVAAPAPASAGVAEMANDLGPWER